MKKIIILTAIFLISAIIYTDITANAFPFSKNRSSGTEQTEVSKEDTSTKENNKETTPAMPAFVHTEGVVREKDPIIKELEEMQRKHTEDMRKRQADFRSKRAALLQNYKERIIKEDPEALKSIINSCTESAIENYMRQKGGYDMTMDHHMMMGF